MNDERPDISGAMLERMTRVDEAEGRVDLSQRDAIVAELERMGEHETARVMRDGPTPEEEAAFDEWLSDPINRSKWEDALARRDEPGLTDIILGRIRSLFR